VAVNVADHMKSHAIFSVANFKFVSRFGLQRRILQFRPIACNPCESLESAAGLEVVWCALRAIDGVSPMLQGDSGLSSVSMAKALMRISRANFSDLMPI